MMTEHPIQKFCNVYVVAALLSLLFSAFIAYSEVVINGDGIRYLQMAATLSHGLKGMLALNGEGASWPFYSFLIAVTAKCTHLSYVAAAYVLDAIFSLITVLCFIKIIELFSSNKKQVVWLAAMVILLAHNFNIFRTYIIRDHGFWAFYLLSILCLLCFFKKPKFQYAIAWSMALLIATLFRIEGVLFLIFFPFFIWFDTQKSFMLRSKYFIQLNTFALLAGLGIAIYYIFSSSHFLGRLPELAVQFSQGLMLAQQNIHSKLDQFSVLLGGFAKDSAQAIFFMGVLGAYFFNVIANVSFVYGFLIIYAWFKRVLKLERSAALVVVSYLLINIVTTIIFFLENLFLSSRYLMALSLLLMLWVPFALDFLIEEMRAKRKKILLIAVFVCMLISFLSILPHFSNSKQYLHTSGDWLAIHVPKNKTLYSNDGQVMYYSAHFGEQLALAQQRFQNINIMKEDEWNQFDYIALRISPKELAKNKEMEVFLKNKAPLLVQSFQNKKGDAVQIYSKEPSHIEK
jgi:hypothetical protein